MLGSFLHCLVLLQTSARFGAWPQRPASGPHSLAAHFDRRVRAGVAAGERLRAELNAAVRAGRLRFALPNAEDVLPFNGWFHGALHPAAVARRLAARQLAVFWPLRPPTEPPAVRPPLLLAYKTAGLQASVPRSPLLIHSLQTHFVPLQQTAAGWTLRDFGFRPPAAPSIGALVRYLRDVGFLAPAHPQHFEHVPVWKLRPITASAEEMAACE